MLYQVPDEKTHDRFFRGDSDDAYVYFGAHPLNAGPDSPWHFAVLAPAARHVSLVGDFCGWSDQALPMIRDGRGIWEVTVPGVKSGQRYKFAVWGADGERHLKGDPYAFRWEMRPDNACVLHSLEGFQWHDDAWIAARAERDVYASPMNIYEMHLGSWQRGDSGRLLTYEEIADRLIPYLKDMAYTHVEMLPVMEHPFDGSWGYQVSGYYAPTARYGSPEGLRTLIDRLHQSGIGVILDWVPAHFPRDEVGLRRFDSSPLYEHEDSRRSDMPQWGTVMLDYEKPHVCSFMLSNAVFWLKEYHADGLRCDAVSAMLYLDFGREGMGYLPNREGGRENTDVIAFFRKLNDHVTAHFPGVMMIAEESTAFPGVTAPAKEGGLGFHFKWNMGWMNDTLSYIDMDPVYRKYHHRKLTFPMAYAFSERFILPLSHDEVVHGKKSLWMKQPGDDWQRFAGLKALMGYFMTLPAKKLLFMGGDIGQTVEWRDFAGLDWFLLDNPRFAEYHAFVRELNRLYLKYPALYKREKDWTGFLWLNVDDASRSVIAYMRMGDKKDTPVAAVINFTPVVYRDYRVALPGPCVLEEILCSDREEYGGSGQYNGLPVTNEKVPCCGQEYSATIVVPPLGIALFKVNPMNQVDK